MVGRAAAFVRCESGATAIEYAVIASGVAMAIAALVFDVGASMQGRYQAVADGFRDLGGE